MSTGKRNVLPTSVVPSNYALTITPDLSTFTFTATAVISIAIVEPVTRITLNSAELKIHSAVIDNASATVEYDVPQQRATLSFESQFQPGNYVLHIEYEGIINDKMNGFYRSSWTDENGNVHYLATTQFEATDARKAFPCWDEPNKKATFEITLIVDPHLTALSNMDIASVANVGNKKHVKFNKSCIMSTYLVAFIVGEFEYIQSKTKSNIECRVYAPPVQQGHFALDVCTKVLDYFETIFKIPYPLPKLDMVAIPDFDAGKVEIYAGAMENWGLVTYRTVALLFDAQNSSQSAKQDVGYTVAHELAHQWFGNLVTMDWWSELWLNEGFATWVGWLAIDKLFPEWHIWDQFLVDSFKSAMTLDAMNSSHPIEVDVMDSNEISQIFDAISYHKGASVIRMLSEWMGVDVFLNGVGEYLKKHQYGNATTIDLWSALSNASGANVNEFMHAWTRDTGFPLLTVKESGNNLTITQSRFTITPDTPKCTTLWNVPLRMSTDGALPGKQLLTQQQAVFPIPANAKFYKLNTDTTGFYRVHYPEPMLLKLGASKLSTADRLSLVSDAFALTKTGLLPTLTYMKLLDNYKNETEYIVWAEIVSSIQSIQSVWFEQDTTKVNEWAVALYENAASEIGWSKKEKQLDAFKQALLLSAAGHSGDTKVISKAKQLFSEFVKNKDAVASDLRGLVLGLALKHGGIQEFSQIKELYRTETVPDQKVRMLAALGHAPTAELIKDALEYGISSDVRPQDLMYLLRTVSSNTKGRYILWKWVQKNWDLLYKRYEASLGLLNHCVGLSASEFSTEAMAKEIESFYKDKNTKPFRRRLDQALEKVRGNAKWLEREKDNIQNFRK